MFTQKLLSFYWSQQTKVKFADTMIIEVLMSKAVELKKYYWPPRYKEQ